MEVKYKKIHNFVEDESLPSGNKAVAFGGVRHAYDVIVVTFPSGKRYVSSRANTWMSLGRFADKVIAIANTYAEKRAGEVAWFESVINIPTQAAATALEQELIQITRSWDPDYGYNNGRTVRKERKLLSKNAEQFSFVSERFKEEQK